MQHGQSPTTTTRARRGLQHFRLADITVQVPFGATEEARVGLLRAAGVPLDEAGEVSRGFLFECASRKLECDTVLRWFDEGSIGRMHGAGAASGPLDREPAAPVSQSRMP
ncbi:hypothetical protein ACGLHS_05640 [Variovorax sp. VaC1]|uniref:hypothetical protein n=1 Tax=Variovorax sp. VaC1 TaxID=3373132 RepID=UPI003749C1EB